MGLVLVLAMLVGAEAVCGKDSPGSRVVEPSSEAKHIGLGDTEPELAFVVFRHGDRTPDDEELNLYPSEHHIPPNIFFPYGKKALTNKGKQRAYLTGKYLREVYDGLVCQLYLPDQVTVRTTAYARTQMTALAALAGMYPPVPAQKWNPTLDWQPIPYNTLPFDEDDILFHIIILRQLTLNPGISQHQISRNLGIPRSTVQLIIKSNQYHAYHVQRVQDLLPADYEPRVRFCREMLRRHREDPQFFNKVLWTDESNFRRMGIFNIHNLHYYTRVNPHIIRNDRIFNVRILLGGADCALWSELLYWYNCPRYLSLKEQMYGKPEIKKWLEPYEGFFKYMTEHAGTNITTPEDVFNLDNLFQTLSNVGLDPPKWAQDVMPKIKDMTKIEYAIQYYNSELIRLASGVLMQFILNATDSVVKNSTKAIEPKLHLISAHENNVAGLMAAARVFEAHQPSYGSTFSLELRRNHVTGGYGIMAKYARNAGGPGTILPINGCGGQPVCDYDKFVALLQDVIWSKEEFHKACKTPL